MNSTVEIIIKGKNTKYFVRRYIVKNNINYSNYKQVNYKEIRLNISYKDYIKLIDKANIYDIKIIRVHGLLNLFMYLKNNISFVICFCISLIILYFISITAFDVNVVHNDKKIRNLVYEELKYYNIDKYKIIPSYEKKAKIIDKIIKNNKNKIEWLEIERKGSKLIVKVTERKTNSKKENLENRHIVAKKSGIIMKVEASDGMILKKVNDYVAKGDIIISGDIIKDDTIKGQVAAKGSVYAEVWYKVEVNYPLYYEEVTYLNQVKNNIILSFFDNEFSLKKNYVSSYLERKNVLIKENIFPFNIRLEKQRKTIVKRETLDQKAAINKAINIASKKINARLSIDEYVISKKVLNFSSDGSKILVSVFFKVYENITDYKLSDKVEIDEISN